MSRPALRPCLANVALLVTLVGCGGARHVVAGADGAKDGRTKSKWVTEVVSPARVFVLPELAAASYSERQPDNSTRLIVAGMRVVDHFDGILERAEELFPGSRAVQAMELPGRLGGGFLFYSNTSGSSLVWKAKTWTGKLEPFANVDMDVESIVPGFDRLYLMDRRSVDVVALDPESGKATGLGSLPSAASYGSIVMLDEWVAAVEVPFQGIMATFDAGASWRALPIFPTYGVSLEEGRLALNTGRGKLELAADGTVTPFQVAKPAIEPSAVLSGSMASSASAASTPEPPPIHPSPLGRRPLHTAVLRGIPDGPGTALVLHEGALGRVRLTDGAVLDVKERALSEVASCQGVTLGKGVGFVCGQARGSTTVYAADKDLALRPIASFTQPRFVSSNEQGALVVRGPCDADGDPAEGGYCIIDRALRQREISVKGDVGVERVVPLSDGRVAVIVPPRLGAAGILTLVDAKGKAVSVKLKLPKAEPSALALIKKGLWLDGFSEWRSPKKKGKPSRSALAGWVVAAGPYVGVRIDLDGKLHVGKIENDIGQSVLSGPLALVKGRGGRGAETTDGGFNWREIELPSVATSAQVKGAGFDSREQGCSRVGCALGAWVRVGYRGQTDDEQVELAEAPPPTTLPSSRGGRWQLECVFNGKVAGPVSGKPAPKKRIVRRDWRNPTTLSAEALESTDWVEFFGVAPPKLGRDDLGFEHGLEYSSAPLRAYAWGARGASWDRVGTWVFRGFDAMSVQDAVWSTAPARPPFMDALAAAQALGMDPNQPVSWQSVLESSGRAAGVLVNARGTMDLYLLEEGRAALTVPDVARAGLYQLSSVVKAGSNWYVAGAQGSNAFSFFRVVGNKLVMVRSYPLRHGPRSQGRVLTELVRTARGDALGLLVRALRTHGASTRWYVYPVDGESGDVGTPLELSPELLGRAPKPCSDGEQGYEIVTEPPVDPYLDFNGSASAVRARRVQARMLVSVRGLCVDQLGAQADVAVPAKMNAGDVAAVAAGRATVAMTLIDRERTGRRWGFQCRP
ncbi:MAG: hypothetical protein R3B13_34010 [Polyangiaceae bacterium]